MSTVGEAYGPVHTIGPLEPPLLYVLAAFLYFVLAVVANTTLDSLAVKREVDDSDAHWGNIDNKMIVLSDSRHESGALHGALDSLDSWKDGQ